jgi:hypothetical protein
VIRIKHPRTYFWLRLFGLFGIIICSLPVSSKGFKLLCRDILDSNTLLHFISCLWFYTKFKKLPNSFILRGIAMQVVIHVPQKRHIKTTHRITEIYEHLPFDVASIYHLIKLSPQTDCNSVCEKYFSFYDLSSFSFFICAFLCFLELIFPTKIDI